MGISIEERKLEDHFKGEIYNYIIELLSSAKEMAASSSVADQDEMNPLIEEIEPFFGVRGEAKVLDVAQNDSGKHTEMVIKEDEIKMESGDFKDILCVEQHIENGDAHDDKMVEGSIDLCKQTAALTHKSSFATISELETSNCRDSITSMAKEDVQIIAHIDGTARIEEDKMKVEESSYPSADECFEGSIFEIQRTEDNNFNNSEKTLEEGECQASNQEQGTSLSDIEWEDEIFSVQHHELETKQYKYPQTLPADNKGVGEIHKEEDDEEQSLKLFFDLAEKIVKIFAKTIKQGSKIECPVEGYENIASAKAEQQRKAIEKVKGMEHLFKGYFKVHIFLLSTLVIAFAILVFFV